VFSWFGLVVVIPLNISSLFEILSGYASNQKRKRGLWLVWLTTVWSIWNTRKRKIFSHQVEDVQATVNEIKLLSWRWRTGNNRISSACSTSGV
jgi:hypothetical protein